MSSYWKQSLWIGGIYWIISQCFAYAGTLSSNLTDTVLSVLLLVFLIPMKWIQPIKKIDAFIKRNPVISTLLVSVGWVPYAVAIIFLVNVAAAFVIVMYADNYEYQLLRLFQGIVTVTNIRYVITAVTLLSAVFMILVRHKSIAGCLDKHFKLIENKIVAATLKAGVEQTKAAEVEKKVETARPEVKKAVKTSVKKTTSKPKAKKAASKSKAKKAVIKKEIKPAAKAKAETVKKAPAKPKAKFMSAKKA